VYGFISDTDHGAFLKDGHGFSPSKRHHSWLLCSMVLSHCACRGQSRSWRLPHINEQDGEVDK
jgi:hypothetical protein